MGVNIYGDFHMVDSITKITCYSSKLLHCFSRIIRSSSKSKLLDRASAYALQQ